MPVSDETYYNKNTGKYEKRKVGQDEDLVSQEKYDPVLSSKEKIQESKANVQTQDQVESSGGLGALARRIAKTPTPAPTDDSTSDDTKKKKKLAGMP